jgi:hypothetical protein
MPGWLTHACNAGRFLCPNEPQFTRLRNLLTDRKERRRVPWNDFPRGRTLGRVVPQFDQGPQLFGNPGRVASEEDLCRLAGLKQLPFKLAAGAFVLSMLWPFHGLHPTTATQEVNIYPDHAAEASLFRREAPTPYLGSIEVAPLYPVPKIDNLPLVNPLHAVPRVVCVTTFLQFAGSDSDFQPE